MNWFVSHARRLRYELQLKRGVPVTIREVAESIEEDRRVIMAIEANKLDKVRFGQVMKLANYYREQGLNAEKMMEYGENITIPVLVAF